MNTYKITDERVLKEIKRTNNGWLTERMLDNWTEEEREGRTDMELLIDEVEWLFDLYNDKKTDVAMKLKEAKQLLKEISNEEKIKNKKIDYYSYLPYGTIQYVNGLQWAKDIISEYERLKLLMKRI